MLHVYVCVCGTVSCSWFNRVVIAEFKCVNSCHYQIMCQLFSSDVIILWKHPPTLHFNVLLSQFLIGWAVQYLMYILNLKAVTLYFEPNLVICLTVCLSLNKKRWVPIAPKVHSFLLSGFKLRLCNFWKKKWHSLS